MFRVWLSPKNHRKLLAQSIFDWPSYSFIIGFHEGIVITDSGIFADYFVIFVIQVWSPDMPIGFQLLIQTTMTYRPFQAQVSQALK